MEKSRIILLLILSILIQSVQGQKAEVDNQDVAEEYLEEAAENSDENADLSEYTQDMDYFLDHPLNLNAATTEDLEKFGFLTDFQIKSLQDYIKEHGNLLSINELQYIYGFTAGLTEKLKPYIVVGPASKVNVASLRGMFKNPDQQICFKTMRILERQQGYSRLSASEIKENPNSIYLGNPWQMYVQYRFNASDHIYAGFTAEKDPGEQFFKGNNKKGFDFYSAHLQLKNTGFIKSLCIGDYKAEFGQGLILWPGLSLGKSADIYGISKRSEGISKYTSSDENSFLRGIGATFAVKNFRLSLFYSNKKTDANIDSKDSISGKVLSVSSFLSTGLHTNPGEIENENALREETTGGNITYNSEKFRIGSTFIRSHFGANVEPELKYYNTFYFRGKENSAISLDYILKFNGMHAFGEIAMNNTRGIALLQGLLINLSSNAGISLLYRYYQKNYQALYGKAFGENSSNSNENGFYSGAFFQPFAKLKISAYYDIFSFPWLKYRINNPSTGNSYMCQVDYNLSDDVQMYARIKNKLRQENSPVDTSIAFTEEVNRFNFRYHLSARINYRLLLRSRIELVNYDKGSQHEKGYYLYQDFIYGFKNLPFTLYCRYGIFDTDGFYSCIYSYENDLRYSFSMPSVFSKGTRLYLMAKYSPSKNADFYIKYDQTQYEHDKTIGSGPAAIDGKTKTAVRAQIIFKF